MNIIILSLINVSLASVDLANYLTKLVNVLLSLPEAVQVETLLIFGLIVVCHYVYQVLKLVLSYLKDKR